MGAWGVYDDEGDQAQDELCRLLTLCGIETMSPEEFRTLIRYEERETYAKLSQVADNTPIRHVAGLVIAVIKVINNEKNFPSSIPEGFPEPLITRSLESSKASINIIWYERWRNEEGRLQALEHQIYFFSRGQEGRYPGQMTKSVR